MILALIGFHILYLMLKIKTYHHTLLVRQSLHRYKCLWGVGARAEVQISRREFHTHIHIDQVRVEFYLVKKKKKKRLRLERGGGRCRCRWAGPSNIFCPNKLLISSVFLFFFWLRQVLEFKQKVESRRKERMTEEQFRSGRTTSVLFIL